MPSPIGPENYICFIARSIHVPLPGVCSVFLIKKSPVSSIWNRAVGTCVIFVYGIACHNVIATHALLRVLNCGITYSILLIMNAAIHDGITDPTYGPRDKILYPIYEDSLGGEE